MRRVETVVLLLEVYNGVKGREVLFEEAFIIKFSELKKILTVQIKAAEKILSKRKTNLGLDILL